MALALRSRTQEDDENPIIGSFLWSRELDENTAILTRSSPS